MSPSTAPVDPPAAPRRGRPPLLTRSRVEEAAFQLVLEHGYDRISMRELADRLGVSAMAVQRITGGRDALDEALVTRLVEAERPPGALLPGTWREVLPEYARLLRQFCARHPAVLAALSRRPLDSPFAQDLVDRVLGELIAAGASPHDAAEIFLTVRSFVVGHVQIETQRAGGRQPELAAQLEHLVAAQDYLAAGGDAHFESGLSLLLAAVPSRLASA